MPVIPCDSVGVLVSWISIVSTFLVGLVTGTFGAVVGSSLLVITPYLVFMGLSPHSAVGTGTVSALARDVFAFRNYLKDRYIDLRLGLEVAAAGALGAYAGSHFMLSLSPTTVRYVVATCMLLVLGILLYRPDLGKWQGNPSRFCRTSILVRIAVGIPLGFYAGLYGGGISLLIIAALVLVFGQDFLRASATSRVLNIVHGLVTVCVFAGAGQIDMASAIPLSVGMGLGGHYGSRAAILLGANFVKWLFVSMVVLMAMLLLSGV